MAPIPVEEQFQFLLSCIRYSNSGKIDFDQVAKECNIVSKGAAAKRYERLMKAHNINLTGSNSNLSAPSPSKSPEKAAAAADPGSSSVASPSKKKAGVKRKGAETKGLPKKARLMKKAAVVCAEDLVKSNEESDKETDTNTKPERDSEDGEDENENGGDNEDDDDDESLFKGVVAEDDLAIDSYA